MIEVNIPRVNEFLKDPQDKIKELKEKLAKETDPAQQRDQRQDIRFYDYMIEHNPSYRLPNMTFNGEMVLKGTKTKCILKNVGTRHTKEDILAHFPNEGICFMGDVFFATVDEIPLDQAKQFFSSNPERHISLLEQMFDGPCTIFHSGHGAISGPEMLKKNIEFIQTHLMG
jgi:hypothetical protein